MKVYIGIPMYGGADAQFVSSLLITRVILDRLGYEVEVDIHANCSVLPKARNEIVKRFIDSGFDVLFFLDADMTWNAVDFVKLVKSGKDFSACAYRSKSEDVNFHMVGNGDKTEDGWFSADSVGTGFICLSRSAIEQMIEEYPFTRYEEAGATYHALFDFELHMGRYWGEDYTFCRRWKETGGNIDVMPAEIGHIGQKVYSGNITEAIDAPQGNV